MSDAGETAVERRSLRGVELEILRRGAGPPILLLHGFQTVDPRARFLDLIGRHRAIIAPSHPGFGHSSRPDGFETVYDLVHLYLDLIDALPYEKLTLMGLSFGGWLAAEIAAACCHRLDRLVLVDPLGIKISDRETPDILDVFNSSPEEVRRRSWHDPAASAPDFNAMSDEAIIVHARNWNALCLYGWHPYMYNPQLNRWLARIAVPTLVLWGANDGIVAPAYGRAYGGLIPGARFALIEAAGHHPEIERPEAFAAAVLRFLDGG
jgi:pimeloyl-ACP methyl ester carboxylesterase